MAQCLDALQTVALIIAASPSESFASAAVTCRAVPATEPPIPPAANFPSNHRVLSPPASEASTLHQSAWPPPPTGDSILGPLFLSPPPPLERNSASVASLVPPLKSSTTRRSLPPSPKIHDQFDSTLFLFLGDQ
ncbi:hypothetical protein CABS02_05632 [Colletotrichum abscissum]|uniref:Uncharacterized protein n=1 Tax=Colletotrichum abscissum TaxID=1671311 RepID=A0A9P9XGU8_9PEZI|nr:hypothetical protein CABS02_05632 [Colletotrichum abscissum]